MDVAENFYTLVETTCRDLYLRSLKEIPPDIVAAIERAARTETKEVAKRIFSHYLQSIALGREQNMMVCQDTGIPIYWVEIGGNLRLDGSKLTITTNQQPNGIDGTPFTSMLVWEKVP